MSIQLKAVEAEVRAQLKADIRATWLSGLPGAKIYDDPPEVPAEVGDLPRSFIELKQVDPNEDFSSGTQIAVNLGYEITLQKAKPTTMTLHAAKMAAADELRDSLTAGSTYAATWNRLWEGEEYGEMGLEAGERYFSVTVRFTVIAIVPAT